MSNKMHIEESFKNSWYEEYWIDRETEEFNRWFEDYYEAPGEYPKEEIEEYYKRKAFALMGWLGRNGELE